MIDLFQYVIVNLIFDRFEFCHYVALVGEDHFIFNSAIFFAMTDLYILI